MLDNSSELGRPAEREIFATRGGPLIRRGFTPCPPTGGRGTGLIPLNALEGQVCSFNFSLFRKAVIIALLCMFCDMGSIEEHLEGKYGAT